VLDVGLKAHRVDRPRQGITANPVRNCKTPWGPARERFCSFIPRAAEAGDFGSRIAEGLVLKRLPKLTNDYVIDLFGDDGKLGAISREPGENYTPFVVIYEGQKFFPDGGRMGE
jgi:hypothetical protein